MHTCLEKLHLEKYLQVDLQQQCYQQQFTQLVELRTLQEHCKTFLMQQTLRKKFYKEHIDFLQRK